MHPLNHSPSNFNSVALNEASAKSDPATRERFLSLGAELHSRGQQPVAQFISELADLAPGLADEIRLRLEAYTRIPIEIYQALGADPFYTVHSFNKWRPRMNGLRPIGEIVAELLLKLKASVATSEVLEGQRYPTPDVST